MEILLLPLLAAIAQAASLISHKIGLAKRHIAIAQYVPLLFFFLTIYAILTFPILGWIDAQAVMTPRSMLFILGILICAIVWNFLYFTAIKTEKVNVVENIVSLSPLTTIFVALLFAPQSFDVKIAIAGAIATAAMIWGYWHKHKVELSHNAWLLLLAVLLMSVENVLVGLLLQEQVMSPVVLFAIRTVIMCAFFSFCYKPDFDLLSKRDAVFIGLISILSTTMMLLRFYGMRDSGIVFTSFILILVPFFVFIASGFILHEKTRLKQLVTMGIVLACVVYAISLQ